MNIRRRPIVVVLGMMSKMPVAGVVWQNLHYLLGIEQLGCEVYYVEEHARTPSMFMETEEDDGSARAAAFIGDLMRRFDLGGRWAYRALHDDGRCYGMSRSQLKQLYASADVIINLHGGTMPLPEHYATGRLVYLETDPVQLQIELHNGVQESFDFLEPHRAFFTFGENLGNADCLLPVCDRFAFKPTRQPVVMDLWEGRNQQTTDLFTSIGNWKQQWREMWFKGELYTWSKHHEFLKFIDIPSRTQQRFELALSGYTESDKQMLEANGWHVRFALDLSRDIDRYRDYVTGSRAEFTVAKDQNVRMRSGWFSDRSATYLAAGRPVVTQETGFSGLLPTGAGLFSFSTTDDILNAVDSINADYRRQSHAAHEIAREFFSHEMVLGSLLADCGVRLPRVAPTNRKQQRVLLVSHRFPPDAVAGVERYTQNLADDLVRSGDEVSILTRRPSAAELHVTSESLVNGARLYRLVGGGVRRDRFLLEHERLEALFEEVVKATSPDVVHINHLIDLSPRFVEIARRHGAAVVLTLHDFYVACPRITLQKVDGRPCAGPDAGRECARTCFPSENGEEDVRWALRAMYFRRALALADRVICPAEHVAAFFRGFGAEAARVSVIANGTFVDSIDHIDQFSTPAERGVLNLAFLGAVLPHKGVHVILEALALAGIERTNLTLFGPADDAAYSDRLRTMAKTIPGLTLRFYGLYEPEELSFLLHDTDSVIVPSLWPEIFCLVAREALVGGVPVLAARVGALQEAIEEGVNGFTFDPERPAELSNLLRRLNDEEDLLQSLREGARSSTVTTMSMHSAAVRKVYREATVARSNERRASEGDVAEFQVLHEAALAAGFAEP
jgi:glycosyltransferase involved in cell wall biosynthesis